MSLKNLFKPTKVKIIVDIILAFFWAILFLSFPAFGFQEAFLALSTSMKIISFLLTILLVVVVYYPLTCSLVFIYKNIFKIKDKEKPAKMDFIVAILLILIWNPFTFGFIYSGASSFKNNVINAPCGVQINAFSENSPAMTAGFSVGDIIISADGNEIPDTGSFIRTLADKRPGDHILLATKDKEYDVQLTEDPQTHAAVLGVKIKDVYCER